MGCPGSRPMSTALRADAGLGGAADDGGRLGETRSADPARRPSANIWRRWPAASPMSQGEIVRPADLGIEAAAAAFAADRVRGSADRAAALRQCRADAPRRADRRRRLRRRGARRRGPDDGPRPVPPLRRGASRRSPMSWHEQDALHPARGHRGAGGARRLRPHRAGGVRRARPRQARDVRRHGGAVAAAISASARSARARRSPPS